MKSAERQPAAAAAESMQRVRRYTWWMLMPFVPVTALVSLFVLATDSPAGWRTAASSVLVLGVAAATGYLLHRSLGAEPLTTANLGAAGRAALVIIAGGLLAGLLLSATAGGTTFEWSPMAGLAAGTVAILVRKGRRMILIMGTAVALALVTAVLGTGLLAAAATAVVGLTAWAIWQTWWYLEVARQLDLGRVQAAELAVANERLRFAAELHDIQGHHLQVIALKSELAARLAVSDPAAASQTMREVQQLARQALTETRSLVGGYRQVSLGTEIANATRVLAAADIDARPRLAVDASHLGEAERLLGLVVREATTNILRHAKATRTSIELDRVDGVVRLVVANDGADTGAAEGPGGGLPALAQRLAADGGGLRWERRDGQFTVTATVPAAGSPE